MRHPSLYKTRFGLYKACIKAMDALNEGKISPVKYGWYKHEAIKHCEREMPDLLPQLQALYSQETNLTDLLIIS